MTPDKVEVSPHPFNLGFVNYYWDHYATRPNNYYEFCLVILTWTVSKTPSTYDTRLSVVPWMNEVRTKTGRLDEMYSYNDSYNW